METDKIRQTTEENLSALEERLDTFLVMCEQLVKDNQTLMAKQSSLLEERQALIQQNEQSRTRIEAMVARLKGLEQPS
jgi:cell division protein ZapB